MKVSEIQPIVDYAYPKIQKYYGIGKLSIPPIKFHHDIYARLSGIPDMRGEAHLLHGLRERGGLEKCAAGGGDRAAAAARRVQHRLDWVEIARHVRVVCLVGDGATAESLAHLLRDVAPLQQGQVGAAAREQQRVVVREGHGRRRARVATVALAHGRTQLRHQPHLPRRMRGRVASCVLERVERRVCQLDGADWVVARVVRAPRPCQAHNPLAEPARRADL